MLALFWTLVVVSAKDELASWNSQYVVEVSNKTLSWESNANFSNISLQSSMFSYQQVDLPFTFSFFFAPLREMFINSMGSVHFDSRPSCCLNTTNCSLSLNLSTGLCNLNTTYFNMIALLLGDNQTIQASYDVNETSIEVRFLGNGSKYSLILYNDSTIELNFGQLPGILAPDWLVGLRRPVEVGSADSVGTWPTAIAGVYPPQEFLSDNSQIVFCPITTVFCVSPTNVSHVGGDVLSITAGLSDLDCIRKRIALSCKFANSENASDFVLTPAQINITLVGVIQCLTPTLPWDSADLKLVVTSTGQELFHDSRSLLQLSLGTTTAHSSICEQCQAHSSIKNCPIDCAGVVNGNASLDDCLVCVSEGGTRNLGKNCRGLCFSPTPASADECLCNQSGVPVENRQPVTAGCWNGLVPPQPEVQDILRATDIVNAYRLTAVVFCAGGLVLLPLFWIGRKFQAGRNSSRRRMAEEGVQLQ